MASQQDGGDDMNCVPVRLSQLKRTEFGVGNRLADTDRSRLVLYLEKLVDAIGEGRNAHARFYASSAATLCGERRTA